MVAECSPPGRAIPRPRFDNEYLGLVLIRSMVRVMIGGDLLMESGVTLKPIVKYGKENCTLH